MNLDQITPSLLKEMLEAWQVAQTPPVTLSELCLLSQTNADSVAGHMLWLQEWVLEQVTLQLTKQRGLAGLPASPTSNNRPEIEAAIRADFSYQRAELEAWSALYYRYLIPGWLENRELAGVANVVDRQIRRRLDSGLRHLTRLFQQAERQACLARRAVHLRRHLPYPDYNQLFGVEPVLTQLLTWFENPTGPRFVSLEGMGGIGKTVLAQEMAYRLAEHPHLTDLVWISARQEWLTETGDLKPLPEAAYTLDDIISRLARQLGQEHLAGLSSVQKLERLAPLLTSQSYLVILDNLETLTDVETLIPAFYPLAGKTRFLLTSRHTLQRYPFVQVHAVPELRLLESQSLIESELARRGRPVALSSEQLHEIYTLLGGVPLALKLVTAQLCHLPFETVLMGLHQAKTRVPEHLFTYIYRRTWRMLAEPAKQLLLAMLLASPEGEEVHWLRTISDLPEEHFHLALAQLLGYSLLEVSGTLETPVYRLHRLTTTFLHTDILSDW